MKLRHAWQLPLLVWLAVAAAIGLDIWRQKAASRPGWLHHVAFHGGIDERASQVSGGRLLAVTGGIRLDLRQATLGEAAHLDATALMGGIDILVPDDWTINLAATAALGGTANFTSGNDGPTLTIKATVLMGGIRVCSDAGLKSRRKPDKTSTNIKSKAAA